MIVSIATPIKPTLFHTKFWSSSKPAYVLKGLGLTGKGGPIEIATITEQQLKEDPILTKLNPQKRLPFFYDPTKDLKLNESGGMIEYLLETYDTTNKLWPSPGEPTRAEFLKLLHFGPATAYHIGVPILFHYMAPEGTEATPVKVLEEKKKQWHEVVAPTYEQALDQFGGPFLLGDKWTAVDVVAGYDLMTISFAGCGKEMLDAHPKVNSYLEKISQCPLFKELYSAD
ncbi:S-transferase-like protein [Seminavis robusta]|uniref:S-transferase-like protein n=1 Tax=Seminavis robusta TaxID=568900 RepID=A0A9N8EAY9_9STRA|nr:S-transferase-like protein [Seminavis robusta]|eukprot:Sro825_g207680.1 S-transferase-like protein (228) ;mRNA; r:29534-30217